MPVQSFSGYIKDYETDLYYANARYYDSFTGRFLREDPFAGDHNTPPSLHRYLYANVNPTVYVDPTGKVAKFNELIEFLNGPVQIMDDEIAKDDTSTLGVIGMSLSSLPSEAASGSVSILNTIANALIVDAENKLKSIHPYANLSNIIGEDTRQIRAEHEAFKNSASNLGQVIADENINLIPLAFEKVGTTLGHTFAGDNKALSNFTKAGFGMVSGGYLARTRFSGPDLDAKLEVLDAYKNKPIMIGESSSNNISIDLPVQNFNRNSIDLRTIKETDFERMNRGVFEPKDFNLTSIANINELHLMWTQAMKNAANNKTSNAYQEHLRLLQLGDRVSSSHLRDSFNTVKRYYKNLLKKNSIEVGSGDIHHWNFSKSFYPNQILDPRNLFHTNSKIQHQTVHFFTGQGNKFDFVGPIQKGSEINIDESYFELPVDYFNME